MNYSRARLRTCAVVWMLIMILAGGQVAIAGQFATPEPGCQQHDGTPMSQFGTPVATPVGITPDRLSHGGPVVDHVSFVDALRGCGVTVGIDGHTDQPFLRAEVGVVLHLSGGGLSQSVEVQSFAYEDSATAAADAAQIGPDCNPPTMMIAWIGTPHFFRAERVIVLYVGDDQMVVDLLTSLLGPAFVG